MKIQFETPFLPKTVNDKKLFKRVHGVESDLILANSIGYLTLVVPYDTCKFTGAVIINTDVGDKVDFLVLDTPTNSISGLDIGTYGANTPLNQFGIDVYMKDGSYKNTSEYDADLFKDMEIYCVYYNNTNSDKKVQMNVDLHEVVE